MNNPFTTKRKLTDAERVEWFRYMNANERAKDHYYRHRDYVEDLQVCPVCDHLTYAADGIHFLCKRQEQKENKR